MTLPELRIAVTEGINRLLHHAWILSEDQTAIIRAQLDLYQNDDEVLQRLYDRLPPNLKGQ